MNFVLVRRIRFYSFYSTPFWTKIPKIPHFGRKLRKYRIVVENAPFLVENFENSLFWAKIPKILNFGRKYPISGENFENTPFLAKMPHFVRKFRKYLNLGENTPFCSKIQRIPPFRAYISKIPQSWRKCPLNFKLT